MENEKTIFGLELSSKLKDELSAVVTWSRIIAICGFINVALAILEVIKNPAGWTNIITDAFSLAVSIILLLFANKLDACLKSGSTYGFAASMRKLATYLMLNVVMIILIIIVAVIVFVYFSSVTMMR